MDGIVFGMGSAFCLLVWGIFGDTCTHTHIAGCAYSWVHIQLDAHIVGCAYSWMCIQLASGDVL